MSRIQRLGIGNGGVDCQISYMQAKKYPNAGEIVKPVQGVSNRTLLKNPYNNLSVSVPQPGQRPLRITTDNRGNVFARSETMLVPGVTNDTLLKNPYNIKSVTASEKRTLTLQRIKDINNRTLPSYITENKGVNEVMLQILTMIEDKPVKLITIQLLKILITKNVSSLQDKNQQKMLDALNAFDLCLTEGRQIFRENTLSPTSIPEKIRPAVDRYVARIKQIYGNLVATPQTDTDIQAGLSELGLLSNALTRMFEYNNAVDPSNTLTRDQINAAAYTGWGQQAGPQVGPQVGPQAGPQAGPQVDPQPLSVDQLREHALAAELNPFKQKVYDNEIYLDTLITNILPRHLTYYKKYLEDRTKKYQEYYTTIKSLINDPDLNIVDLRLINTEFETVNFSDDFTELKKRLFHLQFDKKPLTTPPTGLPPQLQQGAQPTVQPTAPFTPPPFTPPPSTNPDAGPIPPLPSAPLSSLPPPINPDVGPPKFMRITVLDQFVDKKLFKKIMTDLALQYPTLYSLFVKIQRAHNKLQKDPQYNVQPELDEMTAALNGREIVLRKEIDDLKQSKYSKMYQKISPMIELGILPFFFPKVVPVQSPDPVAAQPSAPQAMPGEGRRSRKPQNSKVVFQVGKATQYRKY